MEKEIRKIPQEPKEGMDKTILGLEKEEVAIKIESLEGPLQNIINYLRDDIEKHTYSSVLGEDISGRIPALILGKFINVIYQEKGESPLNVSFYAGGSSLKREILLVDDEELVMGTGKTQPWEDYLRKIKPRLGQGKALLVTDYMQSGASIKGMSELLKKAEINFDVVSMGVVKGFDGNVLKLPVSSKLIIGSKDIPKIYGKRYLAGLTKEAGEPISRRQESSVGGYLKFTHEEINKLVEKLLQNYKTKK